MIRSIDLDFHAPNVIASHVISKGDTHVLVDPGPYSTFPHLATELNRSGLQPSDLAAVLLTHIHFDHAGASWALAQAGVPVYVHPLGYPHMLNPEKLVASATRIYGDRMDELWSVLRPIDARLLHEVADEDELSFGPLRFVAHHTPGHAVHHIAWQLDDALFTGDVAGVKITDGPVQPPCPPPDIHLEDWAASLRRIRHLNPQRLFLAHFGEVTDVFRHLDNLEAELHAWADWVKDRMQQGHTADDMLDDFVAFSHGRLREAGGSDQHIACYEGANPAFMSVPGLMRYWKKNKRTRRLIGLMALLFLVSSQQALAHLSTLEVKCYP